MELLKTWQICPLCKHKKSFHAKLCRGCKRKEHKRRSGIVKPWQKCKCGRTKSFYAIVCRTCNHAPGRTHGHNSRKKKSRTHRSWDHMLQRCLNPSNDSYKNYGGRGIRICERWMVFENFFADMGSRPPNKTLDRKDNNGNYEPGNCRWATPKQQMNNTRRNSFWRLVGACG